MKKLSNTEAKLEKSVAYKKACNSLIIKVVTSCISHYSIVLNQSPVQFTWWKYYTSWKSFLKWMKPETIKSKNN